MRIFKTVILILMLLVFICGMGIFLYPSMQGRAVDHQIQHDARDFLSRVEVTTTVPDSFEIQDIIQEIIPDQTAPAATEPHNQNQYETLRQAMLAYNQEIYLNSQADLNCEYAYEKPCFRLKDYGLDSEIFAVISIPILELEMPVYLGATYRHMADGAALLSQTSIPMGGSNTNAVIAGHRGWGGASYFRYIDRLKPGDTVILTNLWEELHYEVSEIRIIQPYEVEQILIQPGRELITLLTCHPYASGGRQRYLVICERIPHEPNPEGAHHP